MTAVPVHWSYICSQYGKYTSTNRIGIYFLEGSSIKNAFICTRVLNLMCRSSTIINCVWYHCPVELGFLQYMLTTF